MNRFQKMALRVLAVGSMVVGAGALTGCYGEAEAYPPGDPYYGAPPAAFVATTAPVYYDGRPAYWYGNRWYYRQGAAWGYYRSEPRYLAGRRGYSAPRYS